MRWARTIVTEAYAVALVASFAAAWASCPFTAIGTASVRAVRDGRTLQLADGRILQLAAIEAPDASRALQALIGGRRLRLARLTLTDAERDRCGGMVAFVGSGALALQQHLIERGRRGFPPGSATALAPTRFWPPNGRRAGGATGSGPIPILPLWQPKIGYALSANGAFRADRRQGLVGTRQRRHYLS